MPEIYKNYILKQPRQAVSLQGNNGDAIARWCGGEYFPGPLVDGVVDVTKHSVLVPNVIDGNVLCGFGSWVVKDERGRFSVIDNKNFQAVHMEGPVQPT